MEDLYSYEYLLTLQIDPSKVPPSNDEEGNNSFADSDLFSDKTSPKKGDGGGGGGKGNT